MTKGELDKISRRVDKIIESHRLGVTEKQLAADEKELLRLERKLTKALEDRRYQERLEKKLGIN